MLKQGYLYTPEELLEMRLQELRKNRKRKERIKNVIKMFLTISTIILISTMLLRSVFIPLGIQVSRGDQGSVHVMCSDGVTRLCTYHEYDASNGLTYRRYTATYDDSYSFKIVVGSWKE